MIGIDKGIEMPPTVSKKYPLERMDVGDSIFIPADTAEAEKKALHSIQAAGRRFGKVTGRKFKARGVVEGEASGVRCWRVA